MAAIASMSTNSTSKSLEQQLETLQELVEEKLLQAGVKPRITFAVGDTQGCYDELRKLLDKIKFDPQIHNLWFAGDLVNRGPNSLQVLRFVKDLGDSAITVLGNHDLQLLAAAEGISQVKQKDTIAGLLEAPDLSDLLDWLRHQPLLHYDKTLEFTMVHAGIHPKWDLELAKECATELETVLQGDHYRGFLEQMLNYNKPKKWKPGLQGIERLCFISNCFTQMRYCDDKGRVQLNVSGKEAQKKGYIPWYEVSKRAMDKTSIIFGHWASLSPERVTTKYIFPLDSGCVQGGKLTAMCLQDKSHFSIRCRDAKAYS
jgi:bis(5'-nucleosyl)-tetraphosphatase (symmetrical)